MRILFILEHFSPHIGGVEVLFDNLISGLQQNGHHITVLTTRFTKDVLPYEKKSNTLEIYRVGHNRYDFMAYCLYLGVKLAKNADLIHTTTYNAAIPAWIISKITKKKIVITVHEIFGTLWKKFVGRKWPFFRSYEKCIFFFPFTHYICVSNYTRNMLHEVESIPLEKMTTVYNGIDYTIWDPSTIKNEDITQLRKTFHLENSFVGFFFGRPGISKGLEYFIKAIPFIVAKIPNFMAYLLVSKDDKYRFDYVRRVSQSLGVEQHIIWGEKVPYKTLPKYVSMTDFTIVPSLTEGFGFAAVESCCMNKPVIVAKAGSLPEVVSGKVSFVEPGNELDIANTVLDIYTGKTGTLEKKLFLWSDTINQTCNIYKILTK